MTDIDLDCPESIAAACYFLPRTAIFGHASKRASHYIYKSNLSEIESRAAIKLKSVDKFGILEIRIGGDEAGAQTIFPPSSHKETGESIEWENAPIDISTIDGAEHSARAHQLAAAATREGLPKCWRAARYRLYTRRVPLPLPPDRSS